MYQRQIIQKGTVTCHITLKVKASELVKHKWGKNHTINRATNKEKGVRRIFAAIDGQYSRHLLVKLSILFSCEKLRNTIGAVCGNEVESQVSRVCQLKLIIWREKTLSFWSTTLHQIPQERGESCQKFVLKQTEKGLRVKEEDLHATRDVIDAEALRRGRKIERLERELRELKEVQASCDQQRSRRQRSRSHSGSCESSHRCPKRSEEDRRAPKNSRRSKTGRTERKSPVHKPEKKDQNPVWNQLRQISHSPFSSRIERAKLPARIAPLNLITYNGKTDPVSHLSHYRRSMALHNGNDVLMCRIFPSSLGDVALRWFDRLEHGSIHSWTELAEAFTTRFITNTRKPKEVDSLMALAMRSGESLKSYSARYWETYNEIDRWETYNEIDWCGEDVAISQFRFGLPVGSKLRQSLAKKPPLDMSNLMSRIEQHVRVEEDGLQPQRQSGDNVVVQKKSAQPETSRAPHNTKQMGPVTRESFQAINTTFKEPIFKILPQIKNKPYFVWPARLGGDPASRESMSYCAYHREKGHLTETCRNYKALLEELVRDGHLHQFVDSAKHQQQRVHDPKPKAPIGTIDVIHSHARADSLRTETRAAAHLREIFQVSEGVTPAPKRLRKEMTEEIIFTDRDLGRGLGLEHKDLDRKVDPLYGFSGESVMPVGRVTVKVHAGTISSPTDFWVLNSYSPYNAILGRPWLHKMKAVPSTLHQRLRFPTPEGIMEIQPSHVIVSMWIRLSVPLYRRDGGFPLSTRKAVCEEVNRLVEAGAIREILYPTWLSNTVVVKKKNGKWRVCIDFTDLNKACPKDPFPLPKIDQLVDATAGHQRMSFLDAFQGYHQIAMNPVDEEKTAFITPRGIFCYKVMPFGLKNAGATYQRMITKMFSSQLGKTVEVYIDDMVVKSIYAEDHLGDLRLVFNTLRRHHLKLNASKCAFGVGSGKFLGFMVTQRGIEANPDQISAILELRPPRTVREVQKLTGMAAALNRFISRASEKCRPFFDLIKKGKNFHWGEQSDQAFERLKQYLAAAPLLSTPKPVYYTSKTLDGAESRYLPLEKLAFALVCSSKKLPHYFQAHTMIVLTEQPLKAVLRSADFSGRISKWGAQLGAYDINYRPRTSIKGQVLADFIAEFTPAEMGPMWVNHVSSIQHMKGWKLYIDGASNSRGSGLGVVLTAPQGQMMELAIRLGFPASNNVAEYEALLHGLRCAIALQADPLTVYCDSQLVVNQISGDYAAKDEKMKIYLAEAKKLLEKFKLVQVEHIGRDLNGHADALAGLASAVAPELRRIISVAVDQSPSWMSPILAYLKDDILPTDRKEADRIRRIAPRYWVSKEGNLYRRSFTGPYLRCVHPDTVQNLLWEIHEGVCGGHTGGRSLAHRAIGQGYWWPYMQKDAAQYVKKCDKCQRFAPSIHQPAASLNPIASPWPFSQWGLDIVGPLPRAPGNRRWLIVATDYFTKWVEAEPLVHITDADSKRFVWKNIITRFGIPRVLVSDNGSQFTSGPFREFCEQHGIMNHFSTPAYPQTNGQAESSNKTLLDGIKKRLEKAKGRWVEELPNILWTYRTTPRCSTGETPFSLTYGVEAVIPLEIGLPTIRTEYYDPVTNETSLATELDLAEERRDSALIHLAAYQNGLRRIYEKRINPRELAVGDLVLRKVMGAKQDPTHGKLGPNWEGPYKIASVVGTGAFMLIGPDDTPVKRPWNICNLKKYYQ
uniref:RNA-directed DNA polymerase n=1 Tax=Fagus sylvatica TaxID=28930 RepID=A0A2N9GHZ5_FAGSY